MRLWVGLTDRPVKRALEYLFYAIKWPWSQDQATYVYAGNEVQRIAEDGFSAEHCTAQAAIPALPPGYLDKAAKPSFAKKNRRFRPAVRTSCCIPGRMLGCIHVACPLHVLCV
jgi:hypothetical protein